MKMNQPEMNYSDDAQPQPEKARGDVEIAHDEWRAYLDSFSREHLDWLVAVELRSPEGRLMVVEERPLKGVSVDHAEGLDRAYIQVGEGSEAHMTHTVERPVRITLKQSKTGQHEGLEIASTNGTTTVIRFRSAMEPEAVDGLAA